MQQKLNSEHSLEMFSFTLYIQRARVGRWETTSTSNWFELAGVRVTEGKITVNVRGKSRGNRFWFELARGSS